MIADQHVHLATRGSGFAFQTHQQVHRVPRPGTTIENIANNDEVRPGCGPGQLVIEHTRLPQPGNQGLIGAVNIGHSNDTIDVTE